MNARPALRLLAAAAMGLALASCSTWEDHGVRLRERQPLRVAVLPVQCTVPILHLKAIQTLPKGQAAPEDERERVRLLIEQASAEMTTLLGKGLGSSQLLEALAPEEVRRTLGEAPVPAGGSDLRPDRLRDLAERLKADLVLQVRMSGYGKVKRKWQAYLVGSGMVEALVQGVAAYKLTDSRGWGLGVLAEEAGQEILTWVGGVALFNRHFTPVILEARLYSGSDGMPVWSKTVISVGKKKDFAALPEELRSLKEVRLRIVREKAVGELGRALEKQARKRVGH